MIVDHDELENMKSGAAGAANPPTSGPARLDLAAQPAEVRRLLRIKVPLIVQLARRTMPLAAIRRLSLGTIIEFDRSAEQMLDVLINNQPIGVGEAVKVNEHFGLRVEHMRSVASRIRAMGE